MYPYVVIRVDESGKNLYNDAFNNVLTGRVDHYWMDMSGEHSDPNQFSYKNTPYKIFFAQSLSAAQGLLKLLCDHNPGHTWMMFSAQQIGSRKCLGYSETEISKFNPAGKLP